AAGLADPQAKGNPAGPGRTAAGRPDGCLDCPPGEPPTAVALAMVQYSVVDAQKGLDTAAAQDDAEGDPLPCGTGCDCGRGPGPDWLGRLRGPRHPESPHLAGSSAGSH